MSRDVWTYTCLWRSSSHSRYVMTHVRLPCHATPDKNAATATVHRRPATRGFQREKIRSRAAWAPTPASIAIGKMKLMTHHGVLYGMIEYARTMAAVQKKKNSPRLSALRKDATVPTAAMATSGAS